MRFPGFWSYSTKTLINSSLLHERKTPKNGIGKWGGGGLNNVQRGDEVVQSESIGTRPRVSSTDDCKIIDMHILKTY